MDWDTSSLGLLGGPDDRHAVAKLDLAIDGVEQPVMGTSPNGRLADLAEARDLVVRRMVDMSLRLATFEDCTKHEWRFLDFESVRVEGGKLADGGQYRFYCVHCRKVEVGVG